MPAGRTCRAGDSRAVKGIDVDGIVQEVMKQLRRAGDAGQVREHAAPGPGLCEMPFLSITAVIADQVVKESGVRLLGIENERKREPHDAPAGRRGGGGGCCSRS